MIAAGDIRFERRGGVAEITLERPQALNAVTLDMYVALQAQLATWELDPSVHLVLLRGAGPRAFCAGGDVRKIHAARGDRPLQAAMFAEEYRAVHRLHRSPKLVLALAHGITMGGGAGLAVHMALRVSTESTRVAMPEVLIGLCPDVGATRFFDRAPGQLGRYLALTGASIGAADARHLGLFTHHVRDARLPELGAALAAVPWRAGEERAQLAAVLAGFDEDPGPSPLAELRAEIDRCFAAPRVADIVTALRGADAPWAREALAAMGRASPLSLEIVHRQLARGRGATLDEALRLEYRIVQHLLAGDDFYEGVRATLIDKDQRPRWRYPTLAEVPEAEVEEVFASLGSEELRL